MKHDAVFYTAALWEPSLFIQRMSRFGVDFCRNSEKDKKDAPLSNTSACGSHGSGEYRKIIYELPNLIFIKIFYRL